jgi:para-aminobenzoate synthetase component 1
MPLPLVQPLDPPPDVAATLRRFADWPSVILFDSASRRPELGRFSFLAADPFDFEELPNVTSGVDPFARLRDWSRRFASDTVPELPSFQGGAAGLLSYELGGAWERLPCPSVNEFELPCLAVGCYDWVIAWDHQQQQAWIISQGFPESGSARELRAADRLRTVIDRLNGDSFANRVSQVALHEQSKLCPLARSPLGAGHSNFTREEYLQAVARVIEYIRAGDIFQANLSQRLLFPLSEDPLELYLRLRQVNAAPFAGYFAHDDWCVASASPERFVQLCDRVVETRPIKGTRRRRHLPEADLFTEDELRESEKDQAENVMIVDLLRNDLSKVCAPGTIRVPSLCAVETYETVQHLVSVVRGRMDHDGRGRPLDAWDLLAAVFPGGSITGAPKVRAMEIIAQLEPTVRGPYCGSMFYVGFDGSADSNILIRTFIARRGWLQCSVGGGIVAQSDPMAEYAETLHKAAGMLRALPPLTSDL